MCFNDRDPHASLAYECCLCPITYTEQELMDPPRFSHKKKTDREREKERLEKEMVAEAIRLYRERQMEAGKPINPREPLKRTEGNNWVHVHCAVFTPEIKFGDAKRLEPAEGLGLVCRERRVDMCKLCRRRDPCGATVSCRNSSCNAKFHAGCARDAGYVLGFELVSSSKQLGRGSHGHARSSSNVETPGPAVKVGEETGVLVPGIWCSHHTLPANFHEMGELLKRPGKEGETASATPTPESAGSASTSEPINILQLYVQTYKQADLALTGTARKAANLQQSVGAANQAQVQGRPGRRGSIAVNGDGMQLRGERGVTAPTEGPAAKDYGSAEPSSPIVAREGKKKCTWCSTAASPRFYPFQAYMIANAPSAQTQQYPAASPGPPPVN
ncbi:putative PHD type zinc finger protein with BAH domain-containing protein, partial [Ascosphaera atra]